MTDEGVVGSISLAVVEDAADLTPAPNGEHTSQARYLGRAIRLGTARSSWRQAGYCLPSLGLILHPARPTRLWPPGAEHVDRTSVWPLHAYPESSRRGTWPRPHG